jgi:N-acetylglucosamine-6-phosphate deacetylase
MRLRSRRIITPGGVVAGEVVVSEGRIVEVVPGDDPVDEASAQALDLGDDWLAPGFIDLHVHGGGGAQCNTDDPAEVLAMARFHATHGTTGLLATTVAAPVGELETALRTIAACAGGAASGGDGHGAAVLGAHLEGPFLSPERPGAMDPAAFAAPDAAVLGRLLDAGGGSVRMMTLAPELPGALELVSSLVAGGAVASVGHSDARYADVAAAARAGARSATHTFNAMRPLHHREPGVLGAVLDLAEINCELICDGVHVDPAALRLVLRSKGLTGVRLVTDAMQAAGMPDGSYRLGGAAVEVRDGRAVITGGGSIAGSTLTMDAAVRNAVGFLHVSVEVAVAFASRNPARVLGLHESKGAIAPGFDADLVVLDEELGCHATMVAGAWVSA